MVSTDMWNLENMKVVESAYYYSMDVNVYFDLTDDPHLSNLIRVLEQVEKEGFGIFKMRMGDKYTKVILHGHEPVKAIIHTINEHHICIRFQMIHCGCGKIE